ncbi:MAG: UDP-N-acetylmuramoyl-L-alanine--D-glutamate ligase [Candidatus Omnitrophota bacterium]
MRNKEFFLGQRITIVGLARSGLACAKLLHGLGAKVSVTDNQDTPAVAAIAAELKSKEIKVELGSHSLDFVQGSDLVVVSPGVTNVNPVVAWARDNFIAVVSEIEIGWMLCPAEVIAITGSGGKTTVATLIGRALEAAGKKAFICGNIGKAFCGEVEKMRPGDFVSLEVSSFQLERIKDFRPKVAVMLNFSKNHLDRHKDMREYLEAKKRVFINQSRDDYLVLNQNDAVLRDLGQEAKAKVVFFSESEEFNPNQAAVVAVAAILGIEENICRKVFREFIGIEHRMEFVAEIDGVKFINDSKATLAESTAWAIKNIPAPIILIAGGIDKGVDYKAILEVARGKVKKMVLIGVAKQIIRNALGAGLDLAEAGTLEEAVVMAKNFAQPGDCVLLSPMCSSFDMFADYEERGRVFKQAVYNLVITEKLR